MLYTINFFKTIKYVRFYFLNDNNPLILEIKFQQE